MSRDNLLDEYMDSSHAIYKALKTRFFKEMANEGLSPALISALLIVNRMQPVSSADIAKEMYITRGAVAQFVDSLDSHGLIEKEIDKSDRRITHITLTKQGSRIVRNFKNTRNKIIAQITEDLSDDELRKITSISNKILDNLNK